MKKYSIKLLNNYLIVKPKIDKQLTTKLLSIKEISYIFNPDNKDYTEVVTELEDLNKVQQQLKQLLK